MKLCKYFKSYLYVLLNPRAAIENERSVLEGGAESDKRYFPVILSIQSKILFSFLFSLISEIYNLRSHNWITSNDSSTIYLFVWLAIEPFLKWSQIIITRWVIISSDWLKVPNQISSKQLESYLGLPLSAYILLLIPIWGPYLSAIFYLYVLVNVLKSLELSWPKLIIILGVTIFLNWVMIHWPLNSLFSYMYKTF